MWAKRVVFHRRLPSVFLPGRGAIIESHKIPKEKKVFRDFFSSFSVHNSRERENWNGYVTPCHHAPFTFLFPPFYRFASADVKLGSSPKWRGYVLRKKREGGFCSFRTRFLFREKKRERERKTNESTGPHNVFHLTCVSGRALHGSFRRSSFLPELLLLLHPQ